MDSRYIKLNVLPIIVEILFVIACLIFKDFIIYIFAFIWYWQCIFAGEKILALQNGGIP